MTKDNTSNSALEELLVQIHCETAEAMLDDLKDPDKRTPQLYGQILKLLKDNGIDMLYIKSQGQKSAVCELMAAVEEQMELQ